LGKPVAFGYKAQVVDNPDGVVLDYLVEVGNPADAPLLVPAVERIIQQSGRVPSAAAADRGYGETAIDDELHALGVERVAIPRKGTPAPPARPTSTPAASGGWSSGAPAQRAAAAISSTAMAGTGP
jgi:transposase, IS5 family